MNTYGNPGSSAILEENPRENKAAKVGKTYEIEGWHTNQRT